LSQLQLDFLDQWVKGDFDADYVDMTGCPYIPEPITIDKLPVAEQPDMLTRAAMEFCLADAFHPGCEMTWPMRTAGMYSSAFRLKHAPKTPPVNSSYYGPVMNSDVFTLAKGPLLGGQVAGGITRWMAIPWQTDTASCRDGYTSAYDPYLPTFWPARVPNNILSEERYRESIDLHLSEETRKQAFAYRKDWLDDLPLDGEDPNYTNQINSMVKYFDKLAVVQSRPGTPGDENFPPKMQVGITPNAKQEAALLADAIKELQGILNGKNALNKNLQHLLDASVKDLSHKDLLSEQNLIEGAKANLVTLVKEELTDDFKSTPSVKKLLTLLSSKAPKSTRPLTVKHQVPTGVNIGVTEKANRFSRFIPK
jgi:hypothetical protein